MGYWTLVVQGTKLNDCDREHISKLILDGCNEGNIVHPEDDQYSPHSDETTTRPFSAVRSLAEFHNLDEEVVRKFAAEHKNTRNWDMQRKDRVSILERELKRAGLIKNLILAPWKGEEDQPGTCFFCESHRSVHREGFANGCVQNVEK